MQSSFKLVFVHLKKKSIKVFQSKHINTTTKKNIFYIYKHISNMLILTVSFCETLSKNKISNWRKNILLKKS